MPFGLAAGLTADELLDGSNWNQWFKDLTGKTKGNGDELRDIIMMKMGQKLNDNGFFK